MQLGQVTRTNKHTPPMPANLYAQHGGDFARITNGGFELALRPWNKPETLPLCY